MEYQIKLEEFQGPFSLLFEMIEAEEIDLYNIPIHRITRDFLRALDIERIPPEQIADFVLFASILLEIKSRMLLPDSEMKRMDPMDDQDPRHQLLLRLLEYQKVRQMDTFLEEREAQFGQRQYSEDLIIALPPAVQAMRPMDSSLLCDVFVSMLQKMERFRESDQPFFKRMQTVHFSVSASQRKILQRLKKEAEILFSDLLQEDSPKGEWIATFLALLKLQHAQQITIKQEEHFKPIQLMRRHDPIDS